MGGRSGPRPPGRLRPHRPRRLGALTRAWAVPVYRAFYDPDGRSYRARLKTNGEGSTQIYALALMFGPCRDLMLASMSQLEWSEPADVRSSMASAVSGLPTGTVTLLLADVEGSTRLWETQAEAMTAAIARLDATLTDLVAAHGGVRPVEQGEGDSFVVAFARASDAVACALALQRAPLAPIRLRIGVNTGEIQLRDEGNYIGPTINRTARLRDLGHGGQTLLSGATESMVIDHLPDDAWLNDLGSHPLRDLPRPERVVQLCHPDIRNDFPPLRTSSTETVARLPAQLTSFVGREQQIAEVRGVFGDLAATRPPRGGGRIGGRVPLDSSPVWAWRTHCWWSDGMARRAFSRGKRWRQRRGSGRFWSRGPSPHSLKPNSRPVTRPLRPRRTTPWGKDDGPPGTSHRQRRTDGGGGIRPRRSQRGQAVGGRCGLRDDRLAPGEGPDDTRPRSDRPGRSRSGEMRCARSSYGCSRYPGLSDRP